jgi:F-type H+-transporting ATPase subunit a
MDKLHHELWIVTVANQLFGPAVKAVLEPLGFHIDPAHAIPDYLVMCVIIVLFLTALCLFVRSRLSVEHPGTMQILLEDVVTFLNGLLTEYIGPRGVKYLPLIGTVGLFIFTANMIGKIPGFMSPTANINVTVGCAITVWVFYHLQGVREQGVWSYVKHFAILPGAPLWIAPAVLIIELISHASRVLSLSLRLFGNIFGEEMVVLIIGSIVPFFAPLPMMVLGVITGTLQAFIFVMLTIIYLAAAVHTDHDHEHEAHGHGHGPEPARAAA